MKSAYISCIKIKGVPILPPLLTPERKQQLLEDKKQALLLEELYLKRRLGQKRQENESYHIPSDSDKSITCTEKLSSVDDVSTPSNNVPYETNNKLLNLSSDLIDVSEYSAFTPTNCKFSPTDHESRFTSSVIELEHDKISKLGGADTECAKDNLDLKGGKTQIILGGTIPSDLEDDKPRLIRSNSYTLDNPSPLLLEHLKKQVFVPSNDQTVLNFYNGEFDSSVRDSCNSSVVREESEISIFTQKDDDSRNFRQGDLPSPLRNNFFNFSNSQSQNAEVGENQPKVEIITTDITVQQINITTPIDDKFKEEELIQFLNEERKNIVDDMKESSPNMDTENDLKSILKEIPELYAKKILELIGKQREDELERSQNFDNIKGSFLSSGDFYSTNALNVLNADIKLMGDISEINSEAQSIKNSISNRSSLSFDGKSVDFHVEEGVNFTNWAEEMNPLIHGILNKRSNTSTSDLDDLSILDKKTLRRIKEQKAATVICAYVKGYFVRRLMKTYKVQSLIQTIQDALLCALELQRSEVVEEADVELHRRLIQQVSAACYEFHDVFFALSIPEQMDIISVDREKKNKKHIIRSTQSSIDFQPKKKATSKVRLSKSLTRV